ncbi:MAG: DUF6263 family protein [Planctomycetota bacterium]|nr:DUF6263 family protein [Planctomycetota bacterium]MDA1213437.1 DUF6263 family protein [Planctomycetota bacterium]
MDADEEGENDVVIEGLDDIGADNSSSQNGDAIPVAAEGNGLALKLNVGDRFPLIKTVQQVVTQSSSNETITSNSLLKMILEINVEEVKEDRTRMSVRYHQINYTQDIGGERLFYDSKQIDQPLHPSVAAYQGMIDNEFSFWVGRKNGIEELVGFQDFLKRCFAHIPPTERQTTLNQMTSASGDQGVANFIDDSIGLLPYGAEEDSDGKSGLSVGDSWQRDRKVELPIPMQISDKCLLSEIDDRVATIDIHGMIGSVNSDAFSTSERPPFQIEVRGGSSTGRCVIDRLSGLPIQSKIERQIDMVVRMADGQEFDQNKQIITTINAFPSHGVGEPIRIGATSSSRNTDGNIRQASRYNEVDGSDDELPEAFAEPDDVRPLSQPENSRNNSARNRRPSRQIDFDDDLP